MVAADWVVAFLDLEFEALTGVRVGGSRAGAGEATDAPLLRDHHDRPLIPGSSLKGSLRSAAERLLRSVDSALACDVVSDRCLAGLRGRDPSDEELEGLCWTCRLFGNPFSAGRAVVGDLVSATTQTVVRDGVAIDRKELKQAEGLKYDYEVAPPGTVFSGRIRIDDPDPGDVGIVVVLLDLVDQGVVTLGGGASRGLGRLRLRRPPSLSELRASSFVRGAKPEAKDVDSERQRFFQRIEERRR